MCGQAVNVVTWLESGWSLAHDWHSSMDQTHRVVFRSRFVSFKQSLTVTISNKSDTITVLAPSLQLCILIDSATSQPSFCSDRMSIRFAVLCSKLSARPSIATTVIGYRKSRLKMLKFTKFCCPFELSRHCMLWCSPSPWMSIFRFW